MSWPAWHRASVARRCVWFTWAVLGVLLGGFILLIAIELIATKPINTGATGLKQPLDTVLLERGAYLAKLGNCAACHTDRGGAAYAGGKAIHTPFGAVFASNITPDVQHGIGGWSAEAFYRALNQGVNTQGRLLTPAFPFTNYTHISRADSDALHAYFLHAVQPVPTPSKVHELPFPLNTQLALAVWRVLFFKSDTPELIANYSIDTGASAIISPQNYEIERGQYLVQGLGHCSACHAQRNALGAAQNDGLLSGALMPLQDWYAPSLHAPGEAGVQHWPRENVVALLKNGVTTNASALGPMAEVVAKSTQYWSDADLNAAAAYLQSLPVRAPRNKAVARVAAPLLQRGEQLYTQHCATCHGDQGQGLQVEAQVALPALAGNRAVTMASSANLVRILLAGGYAPSTPGNPRPYGMPPFVHVLSDEDIAAVTTYIRTSWGNTASAVSATEVVTQRRGVLR